MADREFIYFYFYFVLFCPIHSIVLVNRSHISSTSVKLRKLICVSRAKTAPHSHTHEWQKNTSSKTKEHIYQWRSFCSFCSFSEIISLIWLFIFGIIFTLRALSVAVRFHFLFQELLFFDLKAKRKERNWDIFLH